MTNRVKVLLTTIALVASHVLSPGGHAETVRIDTLAALDLSEDPWGFDRTRIEFQVDGGRVQRVTNDRITRHGDVWRVGFDITFRREVMIQIYETEKETPR